MLNDHVPIADSLEKEETLGKEEVPSKGETLGKENILHQEDTPLKEDSAVPTVPTGDTDGDQEFKRGKRMLGLVMGTLKRCKTELGQPSEALRKREEADLRVMEKLRQEKEELQRYKEERELLKCAERKALIEREQAILEKELALVEEAKESRRLLLTQFLKTTPVKSNLKPVYYLPKILTDAQQAFLSSDDSTEKSSVEKFSSAQPENA